MLEKSKFPFLHLCQTRNRMVMDQVGSWDALKTSLGNKTGKRTMPSCSSVRGFPAGCFEGEVSGKTSPPSTVQKSILCTKPAVLWFKLWKEIQNTSLTLGLGLRCCEHSYHAGHMPVLMSCGAFRCFLEVIWALPSKQVTYRAWASVLEFHFLLKKKTNFPATKSVVFFS